MSESRESPVDQVTAPATAPGSALRPNVFEWSVRIYHEDTDAGGIVYYANYLRFFERARSEWLRSLGVAQHDLQRDEGIQFVVKDVSVDYRQPARLDDLLTLELDVLTARRASLRLAQRAVHNTSGRVLVASQILIAATRCATGRPVGMPEWLLSRVNS